MTVHALRIPPSVRALGPTKPAAHRLSRLDPQQLSRRLVVFNPSGPTIGGLVACGRRDIANLAGADVVCRVVSHNPDNLWAITRKDRFDAVAPRAEGFVAFLMLNEAGLRQLATGVFDASDPDPSLLAAQNEKPVGIYVWALYARGPIAAGIPLVFEKISTPLYRNVDLFARAATDDGLRFLETLGFKLGARPLGISAPHLHVFPRSENTLAKERPLYDSYRNSAQPGTLSVTVARSIEDLMRVVSVRSAVYISEQDCPYVEEFDGNDFSATHLLGYIGDEPAGCLRIRYFADFAKIERLAVRREYRNTRLAFQLVRAGIELCRVKGYQRLYGHAQKRLVNFWSRFGFRIFEGGRELVFSDYDYVEMVLDADRHPHAISIGIDPYIIIRPEGLWHLPGVLERSSDRQVTRPNSEQARA